MKELAVLFFCFLLSSCGSDLPPDVLPPAKMSEVQWDLMRADEVVDYYSATDTTHDAGTKRKKYYQQIMQKHGISQADFDRSLDYYTAHPELLKEVLDSMYTAAGGKRPLGQDTAPAPRPSKDTAWKKISTDSVKLNTFIK